MPASQGEHSLRTWLTDDEWAVLHAQIRPHTRPVDAFKRITLSGELDIYTRRDMAAVLRQLTTFLRNRGRLEDADGVSKNLQNLNKGPLATKIAELCAETTNGASASHGIPNRTSGDELLQGVPAQPAAPPATMTKTTLPPPRRTILRAHAQSPSPPSVAAPPQQPARTSVLNASDVTRGRSEPLAAVEATDPPGTRLPTAAAEEAAPPASTLQGLLTAVHRLRPTGAIPPRPVARSQFQRCESPLLRIVHCIQRVPVRMGTMVKGIAIPPEYAGPICDRKLRLVLFPVEGVSFNPASWPAARDVVISLNRATVPTGFRRTWPNRQHDMPKSYLAVDVTTMVTRSPTQQLKIECLSRDYYSMVVVAVARTVPESIAADEIRSLCESAETFQGYQAKKALYDLYRGTIEDGFGGGDDDVVVDTCASTVALKCPVTQMRVGIPARGLSCKHMQCFDLQGVLRNCHTACYWSCPICDRPITAQELLVDPYLARALAQAPRTVKAIRHVPTEADPTNWVTAEVEDDGPSPDGQSPTNRGDSLDGLLVSSDDDEDPSPRPTRRATGTSNDPISID